MSNKIKDEKVMKVIAQKPVAVGGIAYLASFIAFVMILLVIIGLYLFFKREVTECSIFLVVSLVLFLILHIFDRRYNWTSGGTLTFKNGVLKYEYLEVVSILGNNKNFYEVNNIKKIKTRKRGKEIVIYGDAQFKPMYGKKRHKRRCIVYDTYPEVLQFLQDNRNLVISS